MRRREVCGAKESDVQTEGESHCEEGILSTRFRPNESETIKHESDHKKGKKFEFKKGRAGGTLQGCGPQQRGRTKKREKRLSMEGSPGSPSP